MEASETTPSWNNARIGDSKACAAVAATASVYVEHSTSSTKMVPEAVCGLYKPRERREETLTTVEIPAAVSRVSPIATTDAGCSTLFTGRWWPGDNANDKSLASVTWIWKTLACGSR